MLRPPLRPLLAVGLALLPFAAGAKSVARPSKPSLEGEWLAPGGTLLLARQGERVTGTLGGQPVLEGTFSDDNLAAGVRLPAVAPACAKDPGKAYVLLLLTRTGKLTGAVTSNAACARELGSLTLQKAQAPKQEPAKREPARTVARTGPAKQVEPATTRPPMQTEVPPADPHHAMLGPPAAEGTYDPRGQRIQPLPSPVTGAMREGERYLREGQFERAREQFLLALKRDPAVGEAYNGVGVTFAMRNDYEQAIDWYKRGLEAAPGFGDLYYNLACSYALSGRKSIALRYLKLAAQKGYAEGENLDRDSDLESLRGEPEFKAIREAMDVPPPPAPL